MPGEAVASSHVDEKLTISPALIDKTDVVQSGRSPRTLQDPPQARGGVIGLSKDYEPAKTAKNTVKTMLLRGLVEDAESWSISSLRALAG